MATRLTAIPLQGMANESEIVAQARDASIDALEVLYRRYSDNVWRVAHRILLDRDAAEDVLQDVFVALPESLKTFDLNRAFWPWLRKLSARVALASLRSNKRRATREGSASRIQTSSSSALDQLAVRRALDALPDRLRTILLMHEVEGFSHAEIGEMLAIGSNASAVRLHRAWQKLKRELDR